MTTFHRLTAFSIFMASLGLSNAIVAANDSVAPLKTDDRVASLNRRLQTVWFTCPDKLWLSSSPVKFQAVFKETASERFWIVNSSGAKELTEKPQNLSHQFEFDFSEFRDIPAIAVELTQTTMGKDAIYKGGFDFYLTVHEGFHHLIQAHDWKPDTSAQRGDLYPGEAKARYYRTMLFENLKKAVLQNLQSTSLPKAAYWYRKWKNEFPFEQPMSVDRWEGVAMYYDVLAVAVSHLGCQATHKEILEFLNEKISYFNKTPVDLNTEGYKIGALASLGLYSGNVNNWQKQIENGASPVELLLGNVTPEHDIGDVRRLEKIETSVSDSNREIDGTLHGDLDNLNSSEYTRIAVARSFEIQRFPVLAMIVPKSLPQSNIFIVAENFFAKGEDHQYVRATGPLPVFSGLQSPCTNQARYVLIRNEQIRRDGHDFVGSNAYVDFRVQAELKRRNGLSWLCAEGSNP